MTMFNGRLRLRYYYGVCFSFVATIQFVIGAPVIDTRNGKDIILIPGTRFIHFNNNMAPVPLQPLFIGTVNNNDQISAPAVQRGPFEFIGQLIQQIPFLPIQINVPDVIQNIGNGLGQVGNGLSQFSHNVTNGLTQFTQNFGNGISQFGQNVGIGFNNWAQNVPILNNVFSNNKSSSSAILFFNGAEQIVRPPIEYPGGQELVLANDVFDAFP